MRHLVVALALAFGLACGAAPPTPQETVAAWFHGLTRDPIRTLTLTTPGFHERHGLRFADLRDDPVIDRLVERAPGSDAWGEDAAGVEEDAALALVRARFGWLTALTKRAFARNGPLPFAVEDEEQQGDRARVAVRVRPPAGAPFGVTFALVRADAGSRWRVDAVEVLDEANVPPAAAFLAAPSAERWARLQQALRQRGRPRN